MSKIEFAFTAAFQEQMLSLMLKDFTFAAKVISYIPADRLYSDAHKYLFEQIKVSMDKKELLTHVELEEKLKLVDRSKRRLLKTFADSIFSLRVENPDFIKTKLTEYAKKCAFLDVFTTAQTFWNAKQHEKAYEYTTHGMGDLYTISFEDDAIIPIEKFEEARQIYVADAMKKSVQIPTGIPSMDRLLRGGLSKGELGIILAEPKKGKSIGLIHMGVMGLNFGRVAHFVLEGTTDQAQLRYLSRLSGIEYARLEKDEITPEEQKRIDRLMKKYAGKLDLIPMNKHWNYTVYDVEAKLKELKAAGRNPDLVVIDYADLLTAGAGHTEKRHDQTEVYRNTKKLAVMGNYAIWTASQAQRPSKEPDDVYLLRAKDISEAYEKVRIADLVATINQTPRERDNGLIRFHLDIYRSNDADETMTLITNYEKMIFYSAVYGEQDYKTDLFDWMTKKKRR